MDKGKQMSTNNSNQRGDYLQNLFVAIALAVLTIIELIVAITIGSAVFLILLATIKAVLVLYYFMHVSRLWSAEEEH